MSFFLLAVQIPIRIIFVVKVDRFEIKLVGVSIFYRSFQILQLQMNDYKYHYLFTTFDIETFDLEDFKYNFVNMTAFRVVDIDDSSVKEVLRDMVKFQSNRDVQPINSSYIQVGARLIVLALISALMCNFRPVAPL